jgi:hypothetical protein
MLNGKLSHLGNALRDLLWLCAADKGDDVINATPLERLHSVVQKGLDGLRFHEALECSFDSSPFARFEHN